LKEKKGNKIPSTAQEIVCLFIDICEPSVPLFSFEQNTSSSGPATLPLFPEAIAGAGPDRCHIIR
jgi:hypothetical protein